MMTRSVGANILSLLPTVCINTVIVRAHWQKMAYVNLDEKDPSITDSWPNSQVIVQSVHLANGRVEILVSNGLV